MFRQRVPKNILSVAHNAPKPNNSKLLGTLTADAGNQNATRQQVTILKVVIVGENNKKRKQSLQVKEDKKAAKRRATDSDVVPVCKSCHQRGHKSSRSPECRNYKASKAEIFLNNLVAAHIKYTRKVSLMPSYAGNLQNF